MCYSGAYTSTPSDNVTGEICPAGGFCVIGSSKSEPCPAGSYSKTVGATNNQDCRECDPGYFCSSASQPEPNGPCEEGYYCPRGAKSKREISADAGFYSLTGSSSQLQCVVGTYQPNKAQGTCLPCAQGRYCDDKTMTNTKMCTRGHYCPLGSEIPLACPIGTYNPELGRGSLDDCIPCDKGKSCQRKSEQPTGKINMSYLSRDFEKKLIITLRPT